MKNKNVKRSEERLSALRLVVFLGVAAAIVAAIKFGARERTASEPVSGLALPTNEHAAVAQASETHGMPPSRGDTVVDLPEIAPIPPGAVRVRANEMLAQVNGKAIQLKDLVPLEANAIEKTMMEEDYQSRLNRAIETELTFQAANSQGVELTAEQKQRLDSIAAKQQATFQDDRKQGINWTSVNAAQIEFEKRLTSALMLQQNLVAKEAQAAPDRDRAVQERFEQALRELLARLKSNATITAGRSS